MQSHLTFTNPGLATRAATSTVTAAERTFAQLWARSGAPALVGYEACLLATLARTDLPMYEQLTTVDLDDPEAVLDTVQAIQDWRRDVAAGTRSISFGRRVRERASAGAVDSTQLPDAA
jgi:hypothetical protein